MIESVTAFLTSLKAATPQILIGIAAFCAILLFSTAAFLAKLGLVDLVNANRAYVGAAFAASCCILLSQLVWWAKDFLLQPIVSFRRSRQQARTMSELTPDEKAYLLPYVTEIKNTQYFRIDDGVSQGLAFKGLIFQAASVGYMEDGWAYNLQPWARRYLARHPDTLSGANELPEPLMGGAPSW